MSSNTDTIPHGTTEPADSIGAELSLPVKFVDLQAQYADIEDRIVAKLADLIHRAAFVGGPEMAQFEQKLAAFCGANHAIGCSDGTSALTLGLLGSGLKQGDGVIVPTNSFIASANAVVHAGGMPVLVDCDPHTYLIDLNQVEDALRQGKAKWVMPVHLYGSPCPMKQILALAERHGAHVIEDNAQAIGAWVDGQRTGSFGLVCGISFYPAKNLGCFGQGGAVLTRDDDLAKLIRTYINQGEGDQRYYHDVVGYNYRLHTMQAAVLTLMLDKLDGLSEQRRQVAKWYAQRLPADRAQRHVPAAVPVYHHFEYRCDSRQHRDRLVEVLKAKQIGFGYHYPVPIHKQKAYPQYNSQSLAVSERLAETLISLPVHPGVTEAQVAYVCEAVQKA